jgi:PTS system galactitol-specific IIA component
MEWQTTINGETMPVLILWHLPVRDRDELFAVVYQELLSRGWVRETFLAALQRREQEYPTGLDFGAFAVAVPHIDLEHVRRSALVIALTDQPVTFQAMDDASRPLRCRLAIFPVLAAAEHQVTFLSAVVTALQQPGFYNMIVEQESPEGVAGLLDRMFVLQAAEVREG